MRNIIHDYPEDKAIVILKNTIAALGPDSVILIDDMVIPNSGAHWHATQIDLIMMTSLGSLERTKEQWYELLEKAGLKINRIYTYTTSLQDSIIECVPYWRRISLHILKCHFFFNICLRVRVDIMSSN